MRVLSYYLIFILSLLPFYSVADEASNTYKVKTDKNGNIYVLGAYYGRISIGSFVLGDSSHDKHYLNSAYFIAKLTPTGTVLWADSITGVLMACAGECPGAIGLAIDNDNNVLISLFGSDTTIYRGVSYYQPTLIKLDSTGNLLWTKRIRGNILTASSVEASVGTDNKNNVYFASMFWDEIQLDTISFMTCDPSSNKTFVAKLRPDGSAEWIKEIASPLAGTTSSSQTCYFLSVDSNGNSYVGGWGNGKISLGDSVFEWSGFYPFLAKLDSNGSPGFLRGYYNYWAISTAHSALIDGSISPSQRLYACGRFRDTLEVSNGHFVVTRPNVQSSYIIEASSTSGDAVWYQFNRNLLSPRWNEAYSICADDLNNSFVIGSIEDDIQFLANSSPVTLTPGLSLTYFAKFDSLGDFQCYQTDTSKLISGATHGTDYYTVGISDSRRISDVYMNSVTIVKWDINRCTQIWRQHFPQTVYRPLLSTETIAQENKYFSLFPNPNSSGLFYIKSSGLKAVRIHIYNLQGQEITFENKDHLISITKHPKGVYLYKVICDDNTISAGKILYQ